MTAKRLLYFWLPAFLFAMGYLSLATLEGCRPSVDNDRPTFAIKDTSQIDQIRISEANGNSILVQRRTDPAIWKLNSGKFDAREDAVSLILETVFMILNFPNHFNFSSKFRPFQTSKQLQNNQISTKHNLNFPKPVARLISPRCVYFSPCLSFFLLF